MDVQGSVKLDDSESAAAVARGGGWSRLSVSYPLWRIVQLPMDDRIDRNKRQQRER